MQVRKYQSFDDFRAAADSLYRRDPVTSTVELTLLHRGVPPADPLLLTVWRDGVCVGAVMQTPPYPLLCGGLPEFAVGAVVAEVARLRPQLPGIHGTRCTAMRFADVWQVVTQRDATVGAEERLYRLGKLRSPTDVAGAYRIATDADAGLLDEWLADFHLQAFGHVPRGPRREALTLLWDVDGAPASIAMLGAPIAGVTRIGPVYPPTELRGRGYGSAVTAAAARYALGDGAVEVVLFADLSNAVSNSIYQRIGFETVTDWVRIDFTPG